MGPYLKLRSLSNIEHRIRSHIQRYEELYSGEHQEKLHSAIAAIRANINYLYYLQLSALNTSTEEQPERSNQFKNELEKLNQDFQEHEQKVSELHQESVDREITAIRSLPRDEPVQGPANRVVTKSGLFGFVKIVQTIPFCMHHYDDSRNNDRLVIGGRFYIRLPD